MYKSYLISTEAEGSPERKVHFQAGPQDRSPHKRSPPLPLSPAEMRPLLLAALLAFAPALARADTPAANLITNGNFETDADADAWPDTWGKLPQGATWETENGNHFLRLTSPEPGKMILMYRPVDIPAGTQALELTWKQRVTNLKIGKQSWFDARIMMDLKNAAGEKMAGAPGAPATNRDTNGWEEKTLKFLVPEGARQLEFMPTLFQVESGTFDLDDIVLQATDPASLLAAAKARAAADAERATREAAAKQAKAAQLLQATGSLITDGDFEKDANADLWPDDWGRLGPNATWETENGNHFLRLKSTEPGKLVLMYRLVDLPADTKALELTWKQRVTDLKTGKMPWFDARIMMELKDAAGNKMKGAPGAPYTQHSTDVWQDKSAKFLIPDGAVTMEFMPCLFQVDAGTFDLDDIVLKPTDAAPILAAQAEAAKWAGIQPEAPVPGKAPLELHVEGNRIFNSAHQEVWLQGLNAVSLEFLVHGDHILRSIRTGIDDWKANIIRLPVKDDYWFGRDPQQSDGGAAYRKLVDDAITMANNRGAYVMLDLHRFHAPNEKNLQFWTDAATHYKNNPGVIFDLFNEPHSTTWDIWRNGGFIEDKNAPADEDAFLSPEEKALNAKEYHSVGMQKLVDAVRATGAKNIVVCGGLDWAYDLSGIANGYALEDKTGNGIMYSTHIYNWKTDWQGKVLLIADKYPIMVGEVGADVKKMEFLPKDIQEDPYTWVPDMLGAIQKYHLNWTGFSFHPAATPVMITGWDYTPTPFWGAFAKRALAGEHFDLKKLR